MTAHDTSLIGKTPVTPPRARGEARLVAGAGNRLKDLRQAGSLKLLFPRTRSGAMDAVLLNTAGGITGGDSFDVSACAKDGARLALTTQAAERAYAAQPGQTGEVRTNLRIGAGSRIDWLPQETILFQASALWRRLTVDLEEGASCLLVEPVIFGRTAMGEAVTDLSFDDRITVWRSATPFFIDATRLSGDGQAHLDRPHVAGGARAMALVVYAAPDAEGHLAAVQDMLPATAGVSLLARDLMVARLLAPGSFELRRSLIPLLTRLRGCDLPRPWMI